MVLSWMRYYGRWIVLVLWEAGPSIQNWFFKTEPLGSIHTINKYNIMKHQVQEQISKGSEKYQFQKCLKTT